MVVSFLLNPMLFVCLNYSVPYQKRHGLWKQVHLDREPEPGFVAARPQSSPPGSGIVRPSVSSHDFSENQTRLGLERAWCLAAGAGAVTP